MTASEFIRWATRKGYKLGEPTPGHTGRKDAWTKSFGQHPAHHVRYFLVRDTHLRKETSLGFGSFVVRWTKPLGDLCLVADKLTIKL